MQSQTAESAEGSPNTHYRQSGGDDARGEGGHQGGDPANPGREGDPGPRCMQAGRQGVQGPSLPNFSSAVCKPG